MKEIAKIELRYAVDVTGRDSVTLKEIIDMNAGEDPDKVIWERVQRIPCHNSDGSVEYIERPAKNIYQVADDFGINR